MRFMLLCSIGYGCAAQGTFKNDGKSVVVSTETSKRQLQKDSTVKEPSDNGQRNSGIDSASSKDKAVPQSTKIYYLPDGRIVGEEKLDSVAKAWGGFDMQRDLDKNPSAIYLLPPPKKNVKQAESAANKKHDEIIGKLLSKPAPDFLLKDVNGRSWKMSSLKGKVVVLNFWFTECKPCIQEMPDLNALRQKFIGKPVVFLALALNASSNVKDFLKANSFTYDILPDAKIATERYGIYAWPTHMVIDKAGLVKMIKVGMKDAPEELSAKIQSLL